MRSWPDAVLERHWGLTGATLRPLERGHTNQSFAVDRPDGAWVLRRAWAGKPATQIDREERVLARLAGPHGAGVPAIMATRSGARHAVDDDGRVLHVFARCPGEPGPAYLEPGDRARVTAAMRGLAQLHRALAAEPCAPATAWRWLADRLARVQAGPRAGLPADTDRALARIAARVVGARARARAPGAGQWLHGDYHLGNLLWQGPRLTAVVDFDDVGAGSAASEAAMALFALARQPVEERFAYDDELWRAGLAAYEDAAGAPLAIDRDEMVEVFCAYQAIVHLEAAQRGHWELGPGIGFLPCWRELTR